MVIATKERWTILFPNHKSPLIELNVNELYRFLEWHQSIRNPSPTGHFTRAPARLCRGRMSSIGNHFTEEMHSCQSHVYMPASGVDDSPKTPLLRFAKVLQHPMEDKNRAIWQLDTFFPKTIAAQVVSLTPWVVRAESIKWGGTSPVFTRLSIGDSSSTQGESQQDCILSLSSSARQRNQPT